ncbi:MAG TPA: fluoride efflux transporter CrcB [Acidimicrobiales bacterium]|nr:fluoride efflux transporter CrcB [Acidimicrobiales bacterium]
MSAAVWVGVAGAGAVGAPARYLLDAWISDRNDRDFPAATLVINVGGSLILGFITGLALYHAFPSTARVILGTGFCGAYTTFSTFAFETAQLVERNNRRGALVNIVVSVSASAAAAALGIVLAAFL